MAADSQCWHCGRTLTPTMGKNAALPSLPTLATDEQPIAPLGTILLYAGLTAVSLLILIFTTRAINQAPLFLFGSNSTPPDGWQPITDSQLQFTLNLPESWHVIELTRSSEAASLQNSPPLAALRSTFDALVADTELIWLGTAEPADFTGGSPVFVLVSRSRRLQQLMPEEFVSYAQQRLAEIVSISEATTVESSANGLKASLSFTLEQDEILWRCQEQFVPDQSGAFLIAACTDFAQFPVHRADFESILRSFQPLGS